MLEVNIGKSNEEMDSQYAREIKAITNEAELQEFAENWGMEVEDVIGDPLFVMKPKEETQDRGLTGNRDKDGNFVVASDLGGKATTDDDAREEMLMDADMITMYDDGGNSQTVLDVPGMVDLMKENGWNLKEVDDSENFKAAPPEETEGNQFGFHKRQGQNFWTRNEEDPYWETHVVGTGGAWSDAEIKKPVKEFDWRSMFG
jgi:hypothetical protein